MYETPLNEELIVKPSSKFIYEISTYRIYKSRVEYCDSKLYASETPLEIKNPIKYTKTTDYILGVFVDWIAAPEDYIKNNKSQLICQKNLKKKKKKK